MGWSFNKKHHKHDSTLRPFDELMAGLAQGDKPIVTVSRSNRQGDKT